MINETFFLILFHGGLDLLQHVRDEQILQIYPRLIFGNAMWQMQLYSISEQEMSILLKILVKKTKNNKKIT